MATQMCLERIYISFHLGEVVGGAMICHALLQQKETSDHQTITASRCVQFKSKATTYIHLYVNVISYDRFLVTCATDL
jgi:hypothetical protein